MIASTQFTKAALILDEAQRKISDLIGAPVKLNFHIELYKEVTPGFILEIVSTVSGLTVEEIKQDYKEQHIVNARFVAFWLMRTYLFMTYKAIGSMFNRDHSTVIYGLRIIEEQLDNIPLQELKDRCGAKFLTGLKASYEDQI